MMIGYIFAIILERLNTPSDDLLRCIVLYTNSKDLFLTRFNIRDPLLRRNFNIKSNKFNLTDVCLLYTSDAADE